MAIAPVLRPGRRHRVPAAPVLHHARSDRAGGRGLGPSRQPRLAGRRAGRLPTQGEHAAGHRRRRLVLRRRQRASPRAAARLPPRLQHPECALRARTVSLTGGAERLRARRSAHSERQRRLLRQTQSCNLDRLRSARREPRPHRADGQALRSDHLEGHRRGRGQAGLPAEGDADQCLARRGHEPGRRIRARSPSGRTARRARRGDGDQGCHHHARRSRRDAGRADQGWHVRPQGRRAAQRRRQHGVRPGKGPAAAPPDDLDVHATNISSDRRPPSSPTRFDVRARVLESGRFHAVGTIDPLAEPRPTLAADLDCGRSAWRRSHRSRATGRSSSPAVSSRATDTSTSRRIRRRS